MKRKSKTEPFRHTPKELAVLNRAHAAMMANLNAGRRYDVVKRAWVDASELLAVESDISPALLRC